MSFDAVVRGLGGLKDELNRSGGGSFGWFKLQGHGAVAEVRFLFGDENDPNLIAVWEHSLPGRTQAPYNVTCLGPETCPLCAQGKRRSLQVYIPLWNYEVGEQMRKGDQDARPIEIWKRGKRDINNILGLIQEYGPMKERDYKIQRHGTKMENTSYQMFPRDKTPFAYADYVNEHLPGIIEGVLNMVAKKTPEEITILMNGGSLNPSSDDSGVTPVNPNDDFDIPYF